MLLKNVTQIFKKCRSFTNLFENLQREEKNYKLTNIFRALAPFEQEAVNVLDNRDFIGKKPNNKIFLTCEHGSKEYFL